MLVTSTTRYIVKEILYSICNANIIVANIIVVDIFLGQRKHCTPLNIETKSCYSLPTLAVVEDLQFSET